MQIANQQKDTMNILLCQTAESFDISRLKWSTWVLKNFKVPIEPIQILSLNHNGFCILQFCFKTFLQIQKVVLLYILQISFSAFVFGRCVFVSLLLITCTLQICLSNFGIWAYQKKCCVYWTLCLFCTLAFLQIWQVCGRGGFPHIFLALIWAMPVSMPVLCLESHSQTLPVKVTKWPSSSTSHVRDMQALWHASGWGWGWFVHPRANSKTLNLQVNILGFIQKKL